MEKTKFSKSKQYSSTIMDEITSILNKKRIKYEINSSRTEITIKSKSYDKDKIEKLLSEKINDKDTPLSFLVKILTVDKTVFIRQVVK